MSFFSYSSFSYSSASTFGAQRSSGAAAPSHPEESVFANHSFRPIQSPLRSESAAASPLPGLFDEVRAASRAFSQLAESHYRSASASPGFASPISASSSSASASAFASPLPADPLAHSEALKFENGDADEDMGYLLMNKEASIEEGYPQIKRILDKYEVLSPQQQQELDQLINNLQFEKLNHFDFNFALCELSQLLITYIPKSSGSTKQYMEQTLSRLNSAPLFRISPETLQPHPADLKFMEEWIQNALEKGDSNAILLLFQLANEQNRALPKEAKCDLLAFVQDSLVDMIKRVEKDRELTKRSPINPHVFEAIIDGIVSKISRNRIPNSPVIMHALLRLGALVNDTGIFESYAGSYDPRKFMAAAFDYKSDHVMAILRRQITNMPMTPIEKEFCISAASDTLLQKMLLKSEPLFALRTKATPEEKEKSESHEEEFARCLLIDEEVKLVKKYRTKGIISSPVLKRLLKKGESEGISEEVLLQFSVKTQKASKNGLAIRWQRRRIKFKPY